MIHLDIGYLFYLFLYFSYSFYYSYSSLSIYFIYLSDYNIFEDHNKLIHKLIINTFGRGR